MDLRKHLKFLSAISLVSIVIIGALFRLDILLAVYVAIIADIIQVISYLVWLIEREPLEKIPEQVEYVYEYTQKREESYKEREKIVSRLVNEGVISENELYSLIRDKEIIIAFPYGASLAQGIKDLGYSRPIHIELLEKMGFIRATVNQNLLITFSEQLPRKLRDIENLNSFIEHELKKTYREISKQARKQYPSSKYKIYEKWRTGVGFSISFILAKSTSREFIINSINKEMFTNNFRNKIGAFVNRRQLKKIINDRKHAVKNVISKTSIDILLADIPTNAKKIILKNEDKIKTHFDIKVFTDYRLLNKEELGKYIKETLVPIK